MWPRVFQRTPQLTPEAIARRKLFQALGELESLQDQVAQPLFKAMAEVGYQPKVKAGARGLNKVPRLPAFLKAQARVNPCLDILSPALRLGSVDRKQYKVHPGQPPPQEGVQAHSATSSPDCQTTPASGRPTTPGYRPNSIIG